MFRFENISLSFNHTVVIKDLSFQVGAKEKVLLYGKSGIGKTTILRLLLGFERLQEGAIYFNEERLNDKNIWDLRKRVAYVSQDLDIGGGNVLELIKMIFTYKTNVHTPLEENKLYELLTFFRLPKTVLNEGYETLSGGEKQRIALIIALLLKRDIFLLDEVTSALDMELKKKVINLFIRQKDWTVIAIAHDEHWFKAPGMKIVNIGVKNVNP